MPLSLLPLLCLFLVTLAGAGCESRKPTEPAPPVPRTAVPATLKTPFREPLPPALYELPSGALATWRDYAGQKPTLLLFAAHPFLDPLPADRRDAIRELLQKETASEIVRRSRLQAPDTVILPPETVSAALDSGFFTEIVLVLPTMKKKEEVALADFQNRLFNAGFLTEAEALALVQEGSIVRGTVRGVPLLATHPSELPKIETPVILHVDLSYFNGLYTNEVKTPAYELIHQTATAIRDAGYRALAATLSFSNQEVDFSLESRFLIRDLADILRQPALLEGGTPPSWELRAAALYATTMFQEGSARQLTEKAAASNPEDAAALYALCLDQFEQNRPDEAFATLDKTVALDRGYGLEYRILAEQGIKMGNREKAIELFGKAAATFPENPFIRIDLVDQLIQAGRVKEARPVIAELRKLAWSPIIHPEIPELLKQMDEAASIDTIVPASAPAPRVETPKSPPAGSGFHHMGMGGRDH